MRALAGVVGVVAVVVGIALFATRDERAEAGEPISQQMAGPDTTGAAVWAHLHENGYEEWATWPEKGEMYQGQAPHGAQLTTYLNGIAADALEDGEEEFPAGSIVVKQNYMPDGTLAAVTTMYKVPGYNPDAANWYFTKHLASGDLDRMPNGMEMEGRVPGCIGCHQAKADNDYIYTGELGG
ncbi:MAG: hypothetical protein GWN71_44530 [Gammaproteobacteria bacterium]|nr:cytochrome P460 family protein [Gemmatimonadota bacterium]NIQ60146.1 cytochrome P460 family protein [Gemmatimonadota bacterium]NIT86873.1 cytochrome P460 family protein [Gemmatimonadota bacterium]NIU80358.1 hypothetical protein [Gammaproteobacteria bacterium]NIX39135.1 hypothetical protein [Gemmatimonadota bacterium]